MKLSKKVLSHFLSMIAALIFLTFCLREFSNRKWVAQNSTFKKSDALIAKIIGTKSKAMIYSPETLPPLDAPLVTTLSSLLAAST